MDKSDYEIMHAMLQMLKDELAKAHTPEIKCQIAQAAASVYAAMCKLYA